MRRIISISSVSLLLLAPYVWPQATKTPVTPRGPSVSAGSQGVVVSGKPAATAAGSSRVYWQTKVTNAPGRALYDKVAEHHGFIVYTHEL